ncbi:MAG: hypothetical protein BAJALOKI3v1_900003 [Promethearchaeota archaeon]|jgi:hypothetical protein|nr:MAG: hypothetical protein BAJALOKI3v1_900003 [Candidatus Lokiarchaeota archaeon]
MAGKACEYDADTGRKVWEWGGGGIKVLVSYNLVIFILFQIYWVIAIYIGSNKRIWLKIFPLLVVIGCELFVLLGFELITTFFFVRTIC